MRIAICDDVAKDRRAIAAALESYLKTRGRKADVVEFFSPDRLMETVRREPFDLYLLDVILSEHQTGIALVRQLRAEQGEVPVVFLSTSREYALDAFAVEAVSYLQKPWTQEAFFRALDRAVESVRRSAEGLLTFKSGAEVVRFPAQQIEYVMTSETVNYVEIARMTGDRITIRGSVRSFLEQYGQSVTLLSAGRSILVNPAQIVALNGANVRFFSGRTVEVPKSVLPTLAKAVLSLSSPTSGVPHP